ncbi:MAG TPA: hypothetical protein VN772_07295 [Solirubrobacteraceae bacterium]|nr:hypothetical protein [Solirubrobacteraceae bacterium]
MLYGPFPHGGLIRGVSDGNLLLDEHEGVRELALQRIRQTGAAVVRIPVNWDDVVIANPAPGFQPRDPASSSYIFTRIDASVRSTVAAGLTPLLVVSHAPAFAEAPDRWRYAYPGSWDPNPQALADFAAALAHRYDGTFPDPLLPARTLPRVRLFQAWNEPNLARYLEPQWVVQEGRWSAFSPFLYRQLLNGFYAGVKSAQPSAVVVAAGVAPNGDRAGVGRVAPVTFLDSVLCLTPSGQRIRAGCGEPAHFDVLAFHPLSVAGPDTPAPSALDVSIADAAKVTRLLALARALHSALPEGAKRLWVTELNWESAPQVTWGVPPRLQAAWISRALHRLWVAGVGLVDWEFLIDPSSGVLANTPTGGVFNYQRDAGLYTAGAGGSPAAARPKPFLQGFAFPFDPLRVDSRHVRVWALLPAPGQRALLQRLSRAGRWATIARLRGDRSGVLNTLLALGGTATLRLQSGALTSATSKISPL